MTRKESKMLLQKMRASGCVIKVEHDYRKEEAANPNQSRCLSATGIRFYKLHYSDDECISATGSGSWGVRNTFADFYDEMRYSTLIEILPSTHYEWGL